MRHLYVIIVILLLSLPVCAQDQRAAAAPPEGANVVPAPMAIPHKVATELWGDLAKDTYAAQLVVSNLDTANQFQINDVIISFNPIQCVLAKETYKKFDQLACEDLFKKHFGNLPTAYSTLTLSQVQGIKAIRDLQTKRARFFRGTTFLIAIASALTPYNVIGPDGKTAIAIASGVGLPAIANLIPDPTPDQVLRLNEMAYNGQVVVGPNQAATFVIFIPNDLLFDKRTWKMYKEDKGSAESLELKRAMGFFLTAVVTGSQITTTPPRSFRSNSVR